MYNRTGMVALAVLLLAQTCLADDQVPQVELSAAIFSYIPDGGFAVERLERDFEAYAKSKNLNVTLVVELLDPYLEPGKDKQGNDLPESALGYDVSEIDLAVYGRIAKNGATPFESLDGLVEVPKDTIGPAKAVAQKDWAKFVLPHWVCGNFFVCWKSDTALSNAKSFTETLAALDPNAHRYLEGDLWGAATLGEYYADAVLDLYGPDEARKHLTDLASKTEEEMKSALKKDVVAELQQLTDKLQPDHRKNKKTLHNLIDAFPRSFAEQKGSALIGYSEQLYFSEVEFREEASRRSTLPIPENDIAIRQFAFGEKSQGTPTWCDGFVVPKQKGGISPEKKQAIKAFLEFVVTKDGYESLEQPRPGMPDAYLMPAYKSVVDAEAKEMPLLEDYIAVLDDSFPILDFTLYQGIRNAGSQLKKVLK